MTNWIAFLLQPVTVTGIGLLVLAVLLLHGATMGPARWLAGGLVVMYFTFATPLGANTMVGLLEENASHSSGCGEPSSASVLIVLAGGITGSPQGDKDFTHLKSSTLIRVLGAADLGQALPGSMLIMSGGAGGLIREADLMASLARTLGLESRRILTDREAMTTYESAVRAPALLTAIPGRTVFLVTSAMHMPRALATFRSQGVNACPYALDRQKIRPALHEALVPQLSALVKGTMALHEALGYLAYRLTGRIRASD